MRQSIVWASGEGRGLQVVRHHVCKIQFFFSTGGRIRDDGRLEHLQFPRSDEPSYQRVHRDVSTLTYARTIFRLLHATVLNSAPCMQVNRNIFHRRQVPSQP